MAKAEKKVKRSSIWKPEHREKEGGLWKDYHVELQVINELAASMPKTMKEVRGMLEHRMPTQKPVDAVPIDELADEVAQEIGIDDDDAAPGYATFKSDEHGLYFEGRAVRGHIKDSATQVSAFFDIKAFKAKVANKVYIMTDRIRLGKDKPDGTETRFIHTITPKGVRNSIKYIDYVLAPRLSFTLRLLDDGVITEEHLRTIFEYGSVHGIGQERSQGWGRYTLEVFEPLQTD